MRPSVCCHIDVTLDGGEFVKGPGKAVVVLIDGLAWLCVAATGFLGLQDRSADQVGQIPNNGLYVDALAAILRMVQLELATIVQREEFSPAGR